MSKTPIIILLILAGLTGSGLILKIVCWGAAIDVALGRKYGVYFTLVIVILSLLFSLFMITIFSPSALEFLISEKYFPLLFIYSTGISTTFLVAVAAKLTADLPARPDPDAAIIMPIRMGKIGVRWDGYVDVVTDDQPPDIKALIEKANAKWKKQYQKSAKKARKELGYIEKKVGEKRMAAAKRGTYIKRSEESDWEMID